SLEGVALAPDVTVSQAEIGLDTLTFMKMVLTEFAGALEEVVGPEETAGYVNGVASNVADWLNATYHNALGPELFTVERIAHVLADLRTRIDGTYTVRSVSADKIVLANAPGLFGAGAEGTHALCQMSATVFGRFAAENTGYARIEHAPATDNAASSCNVTIHFRQSDDLRPGEREYFRVDELHFG
ncbi:MAG: methanogen output domain 1-containing protein, partial [Pseudomonadota bacterium]